MPEYHPLDIKIFELFARNFPCVNGVMSHVLWGHKHILVQKSFDWGYVNTDWGNHHLKSILVKLSSVQNIIHEVFDWLDSSITFPVSTYDEFSLSAFHSA